MGATPIGGLVGLLTGVTPGGMLARCRYEVVAALCVVAAAGVLLTAAWVEMAQAWGAQPARLAIVAILAVGATAAHAASERRRRRSEAMAARARAEFADGLGIVRGLTGSRAAGLSPLVAFAAAFLLARRR